MNDHPNDPNGSIMTVHDIANYLRLSEAKVYKLAKEGQLPALRVGKSWRFRKDMIDEWMRKEMEQALR